MRSSLVVALALSISISTLAACPRPVPADEGEGEGEGGFVVVVGEGEGEGEDEDVVGDGEGEREAGEGEGEDVVVGEGEGESALLPDGTVVPEDCDGPVFDVDALYAERLGYGARTTGGDPDRLYVVDTLSGGRGPGTLRDALVSTEHLWIVFDVDGEIVLEPEEVELTSHKTIDGRGRDVIINGFLKMEEIEDVLVTDVHLRNDRHIEECGQAGDAVVIRGPGGPSPADYPAHDFWFHHVDFSRGGDGLLDLRGGTNITVSWSHFHEHSKGMLMWKDGDNLRSDGMQVTMHHNFIDQLTVRGPRFHYGKLHLLNQYVFHWYDHGAGCMDEAQCLSEGSIWEARDRCTFVAIALEQCVDPAPCGDSDGGSPTTAWVTDDGDARGFTKSVGDLLLNGAELDLHQPERVFDDPGYDYDVEPASPELAERIRTGAGPRTSYCE
jgi:pectate lyase